ncbi:PEPxxWA-CTERM sorting domain-containing protein [Sphingomonas sp.]|uniref:PEPxxWA-CTERM sorting domain-containing protein n=1 Tax=Sphingomonas sp. TaxID=28214 RepID=UPI002DBE65C8|nr:PEPxxWA-CTERM sorting domain-containing protein [Sphingomonas sp.]HEU4968533.1 PEPxxWA-CTERM sorting domain-containing protein [Sphingomonas sp.]
MFKKLVAYVAAALATVMVPAAAQAVVVKLSYDGTIAGTANGYNFNTGIVLDGLIDIDAAPTAPIIDFTNVKVDAPSFGVFDFALPDLQLALVGISGSTVGVLAGISNTPIALFGLDTNTIATNGIDYVSIQGGLVGAVPFTLSGINFQLTGGAGTFTLSAVPEAATWAMMILGFGAVGTALRRRSTKLSFA